MPTISEVQSGADETLEPPGAQESPRVTTASLASDEPSGSEDAVPESQKRPKICDLEWQREGMPDTGFNRKYPPDPWGEEMGPNARVWKVYRDQQYFSHNSMLQSWNKTLDVLLIFAGLFSAVVTAFLVESYKTLQPDYSQYVATFLYAAAASYNRTGGIFPAPDTIVSPDRFIETSPAQRWTNGLWFSSLVISLAVALLCILIKQWLEAYDSHVSAAASSPRVWARRHSLYHRGLNQWGVPGLILCLPLLLHASLFLFFFGLILFLRPLDGAISYLLLTMVSCISTFYVLSLVLPACRVECPSYTPLVAQMLLAASWVISGLLYVIRPPDWRFSFKLRRVLNALVFHQGSRVSRTTHTCDHEDDGHVLSALIHVPDVSNADAIGTAIAAIGAVTSTRTMEIIYRKALRDLLLARLTEYGDYIPSTETGFGIISLALLRRAHWATAIHVNPLWRPQTQYDRGLLSPLGIDGFLLEAPAFKNDDDQVDFAHLIPTLQSLAPTADTSSRLPLRSICLNFLEHLSSHRYEHPSFLSSLLLVFCAGRFASADMHELVRAFQSVETLLRNHCDIAIPAHAGGERDYICRVVNGLWIMLSNFTQYHVDTVTAQMVSHQAIACFNSLHVDNTDFVWGQIRGLSYFVRSPSFGQCVGTRESLTDYMIPFQHSYMLDAAQVRLEDYWACIATLLRRSWDCVPRIEQAAAYYSSRNLFPDGDFWYYITPRLSISSSYATQDDWYEPALSAFLNGPDAIETWTGASSPDHEDDWIREVAELALRISKVLCRRKRHGHADDSFIRGFFSGTFLLARFRDLVSPERFPSQQWRSFEDIALDLAEHCLKLSPDGLMAILPPLEETGDEGSYLRACAVAFAQRIRDGSKPGGELCWDCPAYCNCMLDGYRASPGLRDVWNGLVTRFRRVRGNSATAELV